MHATEITIYIRTDPASPHCDTLKQMPLPSTFADWQAGRLECERRCELSRQSRISPDASRSIPRTGAGAEVV
jgi:hypothetical protein